MIVDRRNFLVGVGATSLLPVGTLSAQLPQRFTPITSAERQSRIAKAQQIMRSYGLGSILIEPGASLTYFTGVKWWRSERLTCAILPIEGEPCIITPFFEAPSVRESLSMKAEIRVWQEDESPIAHIVAFLKSRNLDKRAIGIEETVRFFASDGLARALPDTRLVSANPVVRGCRMFKSANEIALMQHAADITDAAIKSTIPRIQPGMTPKDIGAMVDAATRAQGGTPEFALVLLGEASAYPHGSGKPQQVTSGEPILMDCGCSIDGYQSDVSRTVVLGGATAEQRRVFAHVREGQDMAFAAAQIGKSAGSVDDAVRAHYERLGYGPRYKLPGLSHRTGHGIGMDGHEPVNLVHGETTRLAAGMCFSNEPGLYLPGKFGIRIEDCFHMTDGGPVWFSKPQVSIEYPAD
jgi:Xaa-Pro dipeptidase